MSLANQNNAGPLRLIRTSFTSYPFFFELREGTTLTSLVTDCLDKAEWFETSNSVRESILNIADQIDSLEFEVVDPPNGLVFQNLDSSYPAVFEMESDYGPIQLQLTSKSILAGEEFPDNRAILAIRVGKQFKSLHRDIEKCKGFYRDLCSLFDSKKISGMYAGPAAVIYRYFFGRKQGFLDSIDNRLPTDLLPPIGIIPIALLNSDFESVLTSAELRAWWPVGEEFVFIDAWPRWNVAYEDKYKKLANDLGLEFNFYDIPVTDPA